MDRGDFDRPHGFYVRIYDDKLAYKVHHVIPYKSQLTNHLTYRVMRSPYRVNIWLTDDDLVTQLNIHKERTYLHFSKEFSVEEIVCSTLSQTGSIVVPDSDLFQPGLF